MTKKLLAALISVTTVIVVTPGTALAAPTSLEHTGQGTNDDGTCEQIVPDEDLAPGEQVWHFVLTGQDDPGAATMDAEFNDDTSVTDLAPERTPGQTAHFFVTTDAGASLDSATAYFDTEQAGANPQFVVSNCFGGGENGNGNGNGDDNGNGEQNGDEPADEETPAPVPTDVPAGVVSGEDGVSGALVALAGTLVLAAVAAALLGRRIVRGE